MKQCRNLQQSILTHPITGKVNKIVKTDSKIFTMGSCFAYEIYQHLKQKGYPVLTKQISEDEPELIWYNTYTIRYEFERLTKEFVQDTEDYWQTERGFQDPYRRFLFGNSKEQLWKKINYLNSVIKDGVLQADIIVITLGLTEVFFQNKNNKAICATPGYGSGGGHDSYIKFTNYDENFANINKVMQIIHELNPRAQVVLTVSPVPLGSTFAEYDHVIANTESKSVLRTVAGEICRKYEFCNYFHSYELAMNFDRGSVFLEDARHVCKPFVSHIMSEFEKHFLTIEK